MMNSNRERRHILLVEDEEYARELAAIILAEHTLICARNFDEGSRFAYHRYFDLYILDNWLPDGSGIGLCRAIRQFDPHTPILFCSAAASTRDIREAMRAGAQEYLIKPVIPDTFKQAVARLLSSTHEKVFVARMAEIAAVREELAIRQAENAERLEKTKQKRLRAEEKVLRAMAQFAFLAAGGTRGDFARAWPSVLLEEVRLARMTDAASGD
jgi:DNA-binding response OmpR family regulator